VLREALRGRAEAPALAVFGGLATPEAAAAFLSTGAACVVFESVHWLTDLARPGLELAEKLARLGPDSTRLVGARLGVACRVFDRGNSRAARELAGLADALGAQEDLSQARRTFAARALETRTPALGAALSPDELIFLGPEASFAASFAERFGPGTAEALQGLADEVDRLWRGAGEVKERFRQSPAAEAMGVRYPFIQGGMSWISDKPEFALAVAESGALPTLAAGMRSRELLERDFGGLKEVMAGRPYAVNVMVLDENPFRGEQMDWLIRTRPPFAVIAAGDPSFAKPLLQAGVEVIYLAPAEGLVRLALKAGVRWLVLEGLEAGGHVGEHSTLTLAQIVLLMRRREPELFARARVVLAGGVYDRETAFRAAMLGADAVQMGTVYLSTREIVDTGALSALYQRLIIEAGPGSTALSGETVGLRVRSLKTPRMQAILDMEREYASGGRDEAGFRKRLEKLSVGTLLIASRGVRRPGAEPLDEATCLAEGQFMSGAVSGVIQRTSTLDDLHRALAEGPLELSAPGPRPCAAAVRASRRSGPRDERLAITGMALVNSLGNDLAGVWRATLDMKSGVRAIPAERWDHSAYYDPAPMTPGRTYSRYGAFAGIEVQRRDLDVSPQDFRVMSDSTRLTLHLARLVVEESGLALNGPPAERVGVIVSQNSGEFVNLIFNQLLHTYARRISEVVSGSLDLDARGSATVEQGLRQAGLAVDDATLIGRLNCTAGGYICNRYGFTGPSYSVGAACASSLVALYNAVMLLRLGVIDAALVGGGEERLSPAHFLEFSALGALAGLSGEDRGAAGASRPFDRGRDGFVMGEGGAMIVIERESSARRRGAPIHAYLTGVGARTNNLGIVESVAETQRLALAASYRDAGYGPQSVDLVECHATSTIQGDREEVRALKGFFSPDRPTVLAAYKSQIGHTLGASGLNSLIRGVLAMREGVFPASLNYRTPDPDLDLEAGGLRVLSGPEPWP
ncbi:MAG: beta-ketoacyl synthase N-terminal-like domain-containing protein, partial [Desulfovibrionaceae bacterium]|nr:beta-ketoacyl synthase N-terminal-like domain-containing protein [Desulfovibrionaceae bacterium]